MASFVANKVACRANAAAAPDCYYTFGVFKRTLNLLPPVLSSREDPIPPNGKSRGLERAHQTNDASFILALIGDEDFVHLPASFLRSSIIVASRGPSRPRRCMLSAMSSARS